MDYNSTSSASAGVGIFGTLVPLIIAVLIIASLWKIFEKAGKPGWAALIPIYNLVILVEIVGKPPIWVLWLLIPCAQFVFIIWLTNLLAKSFGKTEGFTVGLILLGPVFYPLLGFGDATYLGPSAAEANGFNSPNKFGVNNPFNQPPNPPSQF